MIEIKKDQVNDDWLDYCAESDAALFSHVQGWSKILGSTYNWPSFFLLARTSGASRKVAGILPLLLFSPPNSQGRLISLPYTDAAGIVCDSREVQCRLVAAALELAESLGAAHLELRQHDRLALAEDPHGSFAHWQYTEHACKIGLKRDLPETEADLWQCLPAKVRNQVRKARHSGCIAASGGRELLDDFYAVFSENMRDLGSPVHDFELLQKSLAQAVPHARCVVIYCRDQPSAGAMVFEHGGTLFNPWASSLRRFRPDCPNMLLYWAMLCLGIHCGCRWFDFGRSSPGASTARFKMQWGATIQPLFWHVFSRTSHSWRPENESLVDEVWKKQDLDVSRRQGPAIRRWISL